VHNLARNNSSYGIVVTFGAIIKSKQGNTTIVKVLPTQCSHFEL